MTQSTPGAEPPSGDDIAALVESARCDPAAFAGLYDRYVQPVYRYVRSRVGGAQEAEDLTAQTFLAALESLPRYRHTGRFAA
ncbi:MAG TPA: sigma factor [Candidatus Acidoferrales bacterium]